MIHLNLENLYKINEKHGLKKDDCKSLFEVAPKFLKEISQKKVGFYENLDDQEIVQKMKSFAKSVDGKYNHIVVLGIGGSALGAISIKQALGPLLSQTKPSLHVLENIDPDLIAELENVIDFKKTLFIVVSKSGNTTETISQYFYYESKIKNLGLNLKDHFVFITDPKTGWLRERGIKEEVTMFEIPTNIGGRFSVLTPVGLLPAALVGFDIDKMIEGAKVQRENFLSEEFEKNLSFQIAAIQYLLSKKGKNINVMYPYSQRLTTFADWYRQLLAESIGKTEKVGITPVSALGVTDQHSQSQLYMDGPNDKLVMFIKVKNYCKEISIDCTENGHYLKGVSFNKLMNTELEGTANALTEKNKPNMIIQIPEVSAQILGELYMLFMGSVAFLGEFYGINAFDQPGVELSKILTKQYLNESTQTR